MERGCAARALRGALLVAALAGVVVVSTAAGAGVPALRLGEVSLHRCSPTSTSYCGSIGVPLDYRSAASPTISIGFRWLPARGDGVGTVLAIEGGPGYASTGSAGDYRAMMGPLTRTRNLLTVDLRGTGTSTPVRCRGLERYTDPRQSGRAFNGPVAACGARLNHTWRYRGEGWVHASDLFNTAYSARDVATVLHRLGVGRVDLYGDSYGSWFSQVFASRYPGLLRSVTLDSTYQVLGLDPWYTTTVITARRAFVDACERWHACASATAADAAWQRIGALAARLSRAPVTGLTTTPAGTRGRFTVTVETLVNLVNNAGFDPMVYQDLDAAGRALLDHGDAQPLLRLSALSLGYDDSNYSLPEFSDGLYFAASCTDYVQLFSRTARPARRAVEYREALRRQPAATFAPFSLSQWTRLDQYTEAYSACLDWPTPTHLIAPIVRRPPLVPARLPVLIMSGDLDSLTPRLDGASLVTRQLGASARLVVFANLTHVTLQDENDACPRSVYQRFVLDPAGLAHENVACAAAVTPVHTIGTYPLKLAGAVPATARPGNRAGKQALQAATVGLAAVGDELTRYPLLDGLTDRGLRGGRVAFVPGPALAVDLHGVRWVTDATVDGQAWWDHRSGEVTARLIVHPARGAPVRVNAHWLLFAAANQPALITGGQAGRHLAATAPAP